MASLDLKRERIAYDRERIKRPGGLAWFMRQTWPLVEQVKYRHNWHIDQVCEHLEAVSRGQLRNLAINTPPGSSKSTMVSVAWNAWDWAVMPYGEDDPATAFLYTSFDIDLTTRDAGKVRDIVLSEWFQERWGDRCVLDPDAAQREFYLYTGKGRTRALPYGKPTGGWRYSTSVGGKTTGWHPDVRVIDDPTKPKDVTPENLAAAKEWYQSTLVSRARMREKVSTVLIMQRLAENDLAGYLLETGEFTHVMIPLEYEPKRAYSTPWGKDPRTVEGESFDLGRFPPEVIKAIHINMPDPSIRGAQYQQDPIPPGGAVFQKAWLNQRWSVKPGIYPVTGEPYHTLPASGVWVLSWDFTFKGSDGSDWVVGQVWLHSGGKFYLVDQVRERADFTRSIQMILELAQKYPQAFGKLIEEKANGAAIMSHLDGKLSGMVAINPGSDGKVVRARAVQPYFASGDVILPADAAWMVDYLAEMLKFPRGKHDDQVDATTQALNYLGGGVNLGEFKAAMENLSQAGGALLRG